MKAYYLIQPTATYNEIYSFIIDDTQSFLTPVQESLVLLFRCGKTLLSIVNVHLVSDVFNDK